jgi:hypothetical protein
MESKKTEINMFDFLKSKGLDLSTLTSLQLDQLLKVTENVSKPENVKPEDIMNILKVLRPPER